MVSYRLEQSRRHVFQLLRESEPAAEISLHGARANVIAGDARYDLEATDDIRKRVVKIAQRNETVARSSSLG